MIGNKLLILFVLEDDELHI